MAERLEVGQIQYDELSKELEEIKTGDNLNCFSRAALMKLITKQTYEIDKLTKERDDALCT